MDRMKGKGRTCLHNTLAVESFFLGFACDYLPLLLSVVRRLNGRLSLIDDYDYDHDHDHRHQMDAHSGMAAPISVF